jgi:hypothetical protein
MSKFAKIRPVGAGVYHAERERERETEVTKLIAVVRNFANAP